MGNPPKGSRYHLLSGIVIILLVALLNSGIISKSEPKHLAANENRGLAESLPNFVFILVDDLGWNGININNSTVQEDLAYSVTNIKNLASKGIYFSNYYAQEMCTPSRAALFTGRYPIHVGVQYSEFNVATKDGVSLDETFFTDVLKDNGYTTYGLGKWNLGHYSPSYLPVSRGFDYYLGYLAGETYYWSKKYPISDSYKDLLYMNGSCYYQYNDTDMTDYSTYFYRDKAIEILNNHDYDSSPMFLYVAFQAVHDPFDDTDGLADDGLTEIDVGTDVYTYLNDTVTGHKRLQYAFAMYLLDQAIQDIVDTVESTSSNTYIIFSSDNGGCAGAGGKNGPLVGQKGTLFEGGTRVDSFVYSKNLIDESKQGTFYDNLMHITDWFPTILSLADISYEAPDDYALDGYDQSSAIFGDDDAPRDDLVYNMYYNVSSVKDFDDFSTNVQFAVRIGDYKLIHAYSNSYQIYDYDDLLSADDGFSDETAGECDWQFKGSYTKYLFNVKDDPYETTDLYDDDDYKTINTELLDFALDIATGSIYDDEPKTEGRAYTVWDDNDYYIMPWETEDDDTVNHCSFFGVPGISPTATPGTSEPTRNPTSVPTKKPHGSPTELPTEEPSAIPTAVPSLELSDAPVLTRYTKTPTVVPSFTPSRTTNAPTVKPTAVPVVTPSRTTKKPTMIPSLVVTDEPTTEPTLPADVDVVDPDSENSTTDSTRSNWKYGLELASIFAILTFSGYLCLFCFRKFSNRNNYSKIPNSDDDDQDESYTKKYGNRKREFPQASAK